MANQTEEIAQIVHLGSVEILTDVGFCVPDQKLLARLEKAGFQIDLESEMVLISEDLLEAALQSLPRDLRLFSRNGQPLEKFGVQILFYGSWNSGERVRPGFRGTPLLNQAGRPADHHYPGRSLPG